MSSRPDSHMSYGGIDCLRVLLDQRGQRVEVVALERLDVAREQLALRPRPSGRPASSALSPLACERRARPLQRAVDRGDARVEELGHLARLPAQHLAQDQHGALPRRQVLERGDERQPDRLAGHRHLGRVRRPRASALSGIGSIQVTSERVCRLASIGLARRAEVHRQRAPLAAVQHVEADVGGDPVQPGAQRRAALEAVEARATRAASSPAPHPRPRTASRASGSSTRSAACAAPRAAARARPDPTATDCLLHGGHPTTVPERLDVAITPQMVGAPQHRRPE